MSYILEALRKSEQERNPTEVPNLKTHHPMIHKEEKSKTVYWVFGIALLLINGFLLAYIFFGNQKESGNSELARTEQVKNSHIENPKVENIKVENSQIENAQIESMEAQDNVVEAQPIIVPPVKEVIVSPLAAQKAVESKPIITELDRASVPDIFDLDYTFQQKIPDMEFSTHIFVSGGGSFVIINGKSLNDGMAVDRGMVLVKILSDGVILRYKGRRFFLASMTTWQRD